MDVLLDFSSYFEYLKCTYFIKTVLYQWSKATKPHIMWGSLNLLYKIV